MGTLTSPGSIAAEGRFKGVNKDKAVIDLDVDLEDWRSEVEFGKVSPRRKDFYCTNETTTKQQGGGDPKASYSP